MKKQLLKVIDKLIVLVLVLTGCEPRGGMCEYGVPHADYEVKGTITNAETKEPIEGIQVTIGTRQEYLFDTLYTDENGKFQRQYLGVLMDSLYVRATDIDGTENGGVFAPDSVGVAFTQQDKTAEGSTNWDIGAYSKTIDFTLKRQEETEE